MQVTNQTIMQVHLVPEITNQLLFFDRIRWYRSTTGRNGFYEAATSALAMPAVLRSRQLYRNLTGTTLRLRVDGLVEHAVAFVGPDPVVTEDVAALISAEAPELIVTADGDQLTIMSSSTGTGAALEVLEGDAAPLLGLLIGDSAVGTDADGVLLAGISEYRFEDRQSSPSTFYAVEYRSSLSARVSPRSAPFQSRLLESVPLSRLIGCYIRLCDLTGRPLGGRRIYIHNTFLPNRVTEQSKTWGLFREYEELVTDPNGYVEVFLIRGAQVDITVAGSGFTRRIQVPMVGTIVNLLDPALEIRDEFGIQRPVIDFAIRTS